MTETLRLHDTLSDAIRPFEPIHSPVTLYVCGVTPYDTTHLGHAFTFVAFDVLIRYLNYQGHAVRYVQNVTDVDDPLFDKARSLGVAYQDLAAREIGRFQADMRALNVLPPDVYPRASREIPAMIEFVERLVASGHTYAVDGRVYFSIDSDPTYGRLCKLNRDAMIVLARERGGDPDDPRKRDPLDFVLWRPSGPDEPRAPSPWGDGLPGWHLECSTMALKYLGSPVDIHGGGMDLIYPHHESEIAQAEAGTGRHPFARFWMHTGMVYLGGEKMSKSLGNMVFAHDLVQTYGANTLRLYLSNYHYRDRLEFDEAPLEEAADVAHALEEAARLDANAAGPEIDAAPYRDAFVQRMNDDLDTPGAITVLRDMGTAIRAAHRDGYSISAVRRVLGELGTVLGLELLPAASEPA